MKIILIFILFFCFTTLGNESNNKVHLSTLFGTYKKLFIQMNPKEVTFVQLNLATKRVLRAQLETSLYFIQKSNHLNRYKKAFNLLVNISKHHCSKILFNDIISITDYLRKINISDSLKKDALIFSYTIKILKYEFFLNDPKNTFSTKFQFAEDIFTLKNKMDDADLQTSSNLILQYKKSWEKTNHIKDCSYYINKDYYEKTIKEYKNLL